MKPIIILLGAFMLVGCLTDAGENFTESRPVGATKFKSVSVSKQTISVLVTCELPNPCWKFVRIDYDKSGTTYDAKVFAAQTGERVCPQVIVYADVPLDVEVSGPGSYTFKFWRYDGTTLDTTIVVP